MSTPTVPSVHHAPTAEPECEPSLFVEFANRLRLSPPDAPDADADAAALRSWLSAHGLLASGIGSTALKRQLPAFRELRSFMRAVGGRLSRDERPTRGQVAAVNAALRDGLHYHALRATNGGGQFRMEQVGDDLRQARASVAGSLAHFLAEHDPGRLRVCANDTCGWLFVDHSPAGRRRWCDMRTCGNRAKVARHRARTRQAARDSIERPARRRSGARRS
jgi:predicted RNA-binding Zn ribbon-like protein